MIMKKLSSIALVGIAIVLAAAAFSRAAASPGAHGFSGHPPSEIESNHGFEGHHGFDGRRNFDRRSHGGVFIGSTLSPAKEKLLLDVCNWLLGRDDLLTKGGDENRWQYPRLILADTQETADTRLALWQWGARLGMPVLFAYLGLVVLLVRRLR